MIRDFWLACILIFSLLMGGLSDLYRRFPRWLRPEPAPAPIHVPLPVPLARHFAVPVLWSGIYTVPELKAKFAT